MKNANQSAVFSLKAPRMRGWLASPALRWSRAWASSRPSRPKCLCSRYTMAHRWRPSSTLIWNRLRRSYRLGAARARWRCRLGIALGDDDAAQVGAVLARQVLPDLLALVVAKVDLALGGARVQEDAPAIVAHLHMAEPGPAVGLHAHGGAQVDLVLAGTGRPHVVPPVDEVGLPAFERALQCAVFAQVHVVRNFLAVIDRAHDAVLLLQCRGLPDAPDALDVLDAIGIENGFLSGALDLERTFFPHRIGAVENPVLPGREPAEDAGVHVFLAGKAQVGFQPGQRVGGHGGALFDGDTQLVVPVDVVRR